MILLSSSLNSFLQLVGVLLIFIFVLIVTYFTTKWVGGFQKKSVTGKSLQMIESLQLSGGKYVSIIKVGAVYLVVAVGKDNVTLLAQLTEEQLELTEEQLSELEQVKSLESFQEALDRLKKRFPKKQD